jgi:nicotinamide riboside kinase
MAESTLFLCLLGAESTGKTELSQALLRCLRQTGLNCTLVPEGLRHWCEAQGRTPRQDEQAAIAQNQMQAVVEAAEQADVVIADTTPLMTAIYSDMLFGDRSIYPQALDHQHLYSLTLLMGLDLPWVADGLQRDGPHVREPVDAMIRTHLVQNNFPFQVIYGVGAPRLNNALVALSQLPMLQAALSSPDRDGGYLRVEKRLNRPWQCEKCSDPVCEHRLFTALLESKP